MEGTIAGMSGALMASSVDTVNDRYYQPSGRAEALGIMMALAVGMTGGIGAAFLYARVDLFSPLVYANVLFVGGYGWVIGAAVVLGARLGKIRSAGVTRWLAVIVTCAGYYCTWVAWLAAVFGGRDAPASYVELASPAELWRHLVLANESGTWSVGHLFAASPPVNGVLLAAVWVGEAIALFGVALMTVERRAMTRPFCEHCNRWCGEPRRLHSYGGVASAVEVKLRLEEKDWDYLGTLRSAKFRDVQRLDLEHHGCDQCDRTHLLTLNRVMVFHRPEGATEKATVVMDKLLIGANDLAVIEAIAPLVEEDRAAEAPPPPAGAEGDDYVDLGL